MITEKFSVTDNSKINGDYITIGELSNYFGATITVALSQNGSELYKKVTNAIELFQYSENSGSAAPTLSHGKRV